MRVVVISGGSSGIGEATVAKFLANGYSVFNLDIVDNASFTAAANYCWLATDLRELLQIQQALGVILTKVSKIDILVVSAGKHLAANIEETRPEQLHELINLNILGAYWLIQQALVAMKAAGGSIITIGSDQSTIAKPNSAVYGMTKAALAHLTKSTAIDYAKYNIRANCIAAGTIDTPLYQQAIVKYAASSGLALDAIEAEEAAMQPLGRIAKANEVAELVYFLAQDTASYLSGAIIPFDGGYTAR